MAQREPSQQDLQEQVAKLQAERDHLTIALETSRQIGTAVGILMATRELAADEAFGLLLRVSNTTGRKLREIAEEVVDNRRLLTGLPTRLPPQRRR